MNLILIGKVEGKRCGKVYLAEGDVAVFIDIHGNIEIYASPLIMHVCMRVQGLVYTDMTPDVKALVGSIFNAIKEGGDNE